MVWHVTGVVVTTMALEDWNDFMLLLSAANTGHEVLGQRDFDGHNQSKFYAVVGVGTLAESLVQVPCVFPCSLVPLFPVITSLSPVGTSKLTPSWRYGLRPGQ